MSQAEAPAGFCLEEDSRPWGDLFGIVRGRSTAHARFNTIHSLLQYSHAAQSLLDDLCGRWSHRRRGPAILVGPRRHGPYWHGQLVDRLPQRVVLAIIRQSETGAGSDTRCGQGLPANGPKAWQAHKPDNCFSLPGQFKLQMRPSLACQGGPEVLAQRYQRLRSFFGTGPLFPRQRATPNINLDVGLLSSGHTDTIADLLRNGVPARYELETNGDHGVLEIRAKSSDSRAANRHGNSAFPQDRTPSHRSSSVVCGPHCTRPDAEQRDV